MLVLILSFAAANAQPVRLFLDIGISPVLTVEPGYLAAFSINESTHLGFVTGESWGAMLSAGAQYTSASTYTRDWYRYRGFFGLQAGIGPWVELPLPLPVDASISAGGILAKYDNSDSYFFFTYVEPAVSIPLASLGKLLNLSINVSTPVFFRADTLGFGIKLGASLSIEQPEQQTDTGENL